MQPLGKSSFGNTILGNQKFLAKKSPKSVTKQCFMGERDYKGQQLVVVDTPGFFDNRLDVSKEETEDEIAKSYQTLAPGPHAFLIVININNRFTKEEDDASLCIPKIFKEGSSNYCLIVFTGLDLLIAENNTVEEFLAELEPKDPLNTLLDRCGRRYIAVNNKGSDDEKERTLDKLLHEIKQMISSNNDKFYTTPELEEIAVETGNLKERGLYQPTNSDGTIVLLPVAKAVVAKMLHRNLGRSRVKYS